LELDSGGAAEIFVRGAGIAVNAAVLAATVGIDAEREVDIGAVVLRQDRARGIDVVFRRDRTALLCRVLLLGLHREPFESIWRIGLCSASLEPVRHLALAKTGRLDFRTATRLCYHYESRAGARLVDGDARRRARAGAAVQALPRSHTVHPAP